MAKALLLPDVARTFTSPLPEAFGSSEAYSRERSRLQKVAERLLPVETYVRDRLVQRERDLDALKGCRALVKACRERGIEPKLLDMSFMTACTRSRRGWLVPQFALVDVTKSAKCRLQYPSEKSASPRICQDLYDMDRLERDIPWILRVMDDEGDRKIEYEWRGTMPEHIRTAAKVALSVSQVDVYLVIDTAGQWNCTPVPADPLLVARIRDGSPWFLLGIFDPSPFEDWVAREMTA